MEIKKKAAQRDYLFDIKYYCIIEKKILHLKSVVQI